MSLVKQTVGFFRDLLVVIVVWLTITTIAYASYHIPSESMVPTLEVGDRLLVNKFAYGYSKYSMPFHLNISDDRLMPGKAKVGDVVVFWVPGGCANTRPSANPLMRVVGAITGALQPSDGCPYIKRVIGIGGDRIQMRRGRLFINGTQVPRERLRTVDAGRYQFTEYLETLPNGVTHKIFEHSDGYPLDDTREFVVPPGQYFVMGDNRDNSEDSRAGKIFTHVPAQWLIGRADLTSFSLADCNEAKGIDCILGAPLERFFNPL